MSHFGLCESFLFLLKLLTVTTLCHGIFQQLKFRIYHHHHYFIMWVFFDVRIDTFNLLLQSTQSLLANCDINLLWSGPTSYFCFNLNLYCNLYCHLICCPTYLCDDETFPSSPFELCTPCYQAALKMAKLAPKTSLNFGFLTLAIFCIESIFLSRLHYFFSSMPVILHMEWSRSLRGLKLCFGIDIVKGFLWPFNSLCSWNLLLNWFTLCC